MLIEWANDFMEPMIHTRFNSTEVLGKSPVDYLRILGNIPPVTIYKSLPIA